MNRITTKRHARSALTLAVVAFWMILGNQAIFAQSLPAGLDARLVAVSNGPSGLKWIGGNRENQLMNPGMSCIGCHSKGEGPRFSVAGTVYTKVDEKDLDFGVEAAVITITDAKGQVIKLTSNKAGNFMSNKGLTYPITAVVSYKGKERAMYSPQKTGDCMLCHQAKGIAGAPGRVMIP